MNTYTLRCGEEVAIGVECALPPMGRDSAIRQWVRNVRLSAVNGLRRFAEFTPATQDFQLRNIDFISAFRAGPNLR